MDSSVVRSFKRMVNGAILCTTARPCSSTSRACFSVHGIKGFWCRSRTQTMHAFLRKSLIAVGLGGRIVIPHG